MKHDPPVILVVLAPDRFGLAGGHIAVSAEKEAIRQAFVIPTHEGRVRVVVESDATVESYSRALLDHGDRIIGFHFAGHATASGVVLGTESGRPDGMHVRGLAETLGQLPRLRWVFLNGCDTAPQIEAVQATCPVPLVATRGAILDDVAIEFAGWFYEAFARGWSIARAFAYAEGLVRRRAPDGAGAAALTRMLRPAVASSPAWPWVLAEAPGGSGSDFVLPVAQVERARPAWLAPLGLVLVGAVVAIGALRLFGAGPSDGSESDRGAVAAAPDAALQPDAVLLPDVAAPQRDAATVDIGVDSAPAPPDQGQDSEPDAAPEVRVSRRVSSGSRSARICVRDEKARLNRTIPRRDCCVAPRAAVGGIADLIWRDVGGRCTAVLLCAAIDAADRCR